MGTIRRTDPDRAHLTAKAKTPVDAADPTQKPLLEAGLDTLAFDADLGATWTEASRSFALDPVTVEIGGIAKASAHLALANVPRGVFAPDPQQVAAMTARIEAGPLDITLQDTGGVDMLVEQEARKKNISADDARRAIVASIKASIAATTSGNPDAVAILDALAHFVESPKGTLTVRLTPRAKAPLLQLIQLAKTQPLDALAQFQVEISPAPR